MKKFTPFALAVASALTVLVAIGCKSSPAVRAAAASATIREMHAEILEAQKKVGAKFKALPEADAIRLNMDKNLDGWAVSEKNLSATEEAQEKVLIGFQKDAKDEALIGELRLYTKKVAKACQESIPDIEARITQHKKDLENGNWTVQNMKVPLTDQDKVNWANRMKVFALQVEYLKEKQRIAEAYEPKLSKLLS